MSGVMGTITSSGAPIYAIVMQHAPSATLCATVNVAFFFGATTSLILLASIDRLDSGQHLLRLILLPALISGFTVSYIAPFIPREALRHFLLGSQGSAPSAC